MIKELLFNKIFKKHLLGFSKYTFVGIIVSILNIFFVWLMIDVFEINTIISASIVVGTLFFLKFYLYIAMKLIKKNFLKYTSIQIFSAILNVVLTWFFIDIFGIPTVIASSSVVIILFIGRFILFNISGLTTE